MMVRKRRVPLRLRRGGVESLQRDSCREFALLFIALRFVLLSLLGPFIFFIYMWFSSWRS